jgi:hypothetical protein
MCRTIPDLRVERQLKVQIFDRGRLPAALFRVFCSFAGRTPRATIPPREGAVAWGDDHPRDAILQEIDAKGKSVWKNESGYHRRSIAENMMYRLKQLGDTLYSRTFERQVTEAHVRAAILNTFTYLGMPESVRVGQIAPAA